MNKMVIHDRATVMARVANKTIHLLDLDQGMSLTNALSQQFCKTVASRVTGDPAANPEDFKFVCYHTDGEVTEYDPRQDRFSFVPPDDARVNKEFLREMFYRYGS